MKDERGMESAAAAVPATDKGSTNPPPRMQDSAARSQVKNLLCSFEVISLFCLWSVCLNVIIRLNFVKAVS